MWDSGLGLSVWLAREIMAPSSGSSQRCLRERLLHEGAHILELGLRISISSSTSADSMFIGTGTGFVALVLGAALAFMESAKQCSILATDLREHFMTAVSLF